MASNYNLVTDPTGAATNPGVDPNDPMYRAALLQALDSASNGGVNPGGASVGSVTQPNIATGGATDPNDPNAAALARQNGIESAIGAGASGPAASASTPYTGPKGPAFTPSPNAPAGQYTPTTAQAEWASNGGVGPEPGTSSSSGAYDPSAQADALLKKYNYKDNGRGSGFGDKAYWLDQIAASGGQNSNLWSRWENDLAGKGTDNPGPGDSGNTSKDPNVGGGTSGSNAVQALSAAQGGSSNPLGSIGNDGSILSRILAVISQLGG